MIDEQIAGGKKRYYVVLFYIEIGEQNGTMKTETLFAMNEYQALAFGIKKYGDEQASMPLSGYSVYECNLVLNT